MNKTIIIAEAGVNHNGNLENAFRLIDVAKDSGADYVKFQTFKTELLVSKEALMANYQIENIGDGTVSQFAMLKKLELDYDSHILLKEYAVRKGIKFLSTGFDEESVDFLDNLGVDVYKIPSGELTNYPLLKHIASKKKPVILSTGMAFLSDVEKALEALTNNGVKRSEVIILHCSTAYPTPLVDVNLLAMSTLKSAFGVRVGYSDHTLGIEVPIAAVALGAVLIEKHFTLDKSMEGPDHKASLDPFELKSMITSIRNIELAMSGSGLKEPSVSERKNLSASRKCIHIKNAIKHGDKIEGSNLIMLRPGDGISPFEVDAVIGSFANRDLPSQHKLNWSDLV